MDEAIYWKNRALSAEADCKRLRIQCDHAYEQAATAVRATTKLREEIADLKSRLLDRLLKRGSH